MSKKIFISADHGMAIIYLRVLSPRGLPSKWTTTHHARATLIRHAARLKTNPVRWGESTPRHRTGVEPTVLKYKGLRPTR